MGITRQEENLFAEWRESRTGFVADGVADEQEYQASTPKLLFILKEVNDPDGGDWDLRKYMREGGRSQTWNNITRWTEGIRNISSDLSWQDLNEIDEPRRIKAITSIAAMNLKKAPGGYTADHAQLTIVAAEDKEFLNRQFALYDPDIIICCGTPTSDTFHWLIDFEENPAWKVTRRGIWFHEFKPGKFVIRYAHPEARVADCILYYGLVDAVREILQG